MWQQVFDIPTKRIRMACGVATVEGSTTPEVVVAGGRAEDTFEKLDVVEIFSFETMRWRTAGN